MHILLSGHLENKVNTKYNMHSNMRDKYLCEDLSIISSKEIIDYHQSNINYVMVRSNPEDTRNEPKSYSQMHIFITACYNATSVCRSRLVTPPHILFRLGVWKAENIWKLLRAYIMKWKITQWWSTLSTISTKRAITSHLKSLKTKTT